VNITCVSIFTGIEIEEVIKLIFASEFIHYLNHYMW